MSGVAFFYSPIKLPDAVAPSGLRRVAGLFVQALQLAGYRVETPDLPLTYEGRGDVARQRALRATAEAVAGDLLGRLRERNVRPSLWLTYHNYYKSPDLIGPQIAKATGCVYAIAEGSHAQKRAHGPWATHHAAAEKALHAADVLLATTQQDREGLELASRRIGSVFAFPPFIDCEAFASVKRAPSWARTTILTAGSMSDGRKLESYRRMFAALNALPSHTGALLIAGDGAHRATIEREAEAVRAQGWTVSFTGQLPHNAMPEFFSHGDLFAWPGVGEAYGLTYLEAQASGLPVIAEKWGGVSACVRDGMSGRLTDPNQSGAFAAALAQLIEQKSLCRSLGESARAWVTTERSLPAAALRLREILAGVRR